MANELLALRRRALLAVGEDDSDGYVKKGLVFRLDGINRGTTDTSKWVDLIGGVEFNGESTWGTDHRICSPYTKMTANNMTEPNLLGCTVEFVFNIDSTSANGKMYMCSIKESNDSPNPCFGKNNAYYLLTNSSSYKRSFTDTEMPFSQNHCISYDTSKIIIDGVVVTAGAGNYFWGNTDGTTTIGNVLGKLYAIRFYNRLLTNDEILSNQRRDNERFNLGLNI